MTTNYTAIKSVSRVMVVGGIVLIGAFLLSLSRAATPYANVEAETGKLASGASVVADATASSSKAVLFGTSSTIITGLSGCNSGGVVAPCIGSNTTGDTGWGAPLFEDEFNEASLNTKVWSPDYFGNDTIQNNTTMLSSNVSLSDGNLNLEVQNGAEGTGGLVSSNPSDEQPDHSDGFQFTYGYAEARIYLPASGSTIANWPAWWTVGQDWPMDGEMDIMEGLTGSACYHFHYGTSPSDNNGPGGCASGNYSGWHIYGADWKPGSVTFYYDGNAVGSITAGITSAPMFLILENSTGPYGGTIVTPSTMEVDYVRVWQN